MRTYRYKFTKNGLEYWVTKQTSSYKRKPQRRSAEFDYISTVASKGIVSVAKALLGSNNEKKRKY